MKKSDITYEDKLVELRLDTSHPSNEGRVFVLFEGDTDIRLYRKLFDPDVCKVEHVPGGKFKLEDCVEKLSNSFQDLIGIRDADFLHIGSARYSRRNMFLTDCHDMEMTFIGFDSVFSSVVFEHAEFPKTEHPKIRELILAALSEVSYLKWLNSEETLELAVSTNFTECISFDPLAFDFSTYFTRVVAKSANPRLTDEIAISEKVLALKSKAPNPYHLTNGHDFMATLAKYLNEFGDAKQVGKDSLTSVCRMLFSPELFRETELFQNLSEWSEDNGHMIFGKT